MHPRRSKLVRMLCCAVIGALLALSVSLPASAGTATLSWQAPTTYTDGSALTDIAGYRVYYGTASKAYTNTVDIAGNVTTAQIGNLPDGATVYFAVTVRDGTGAESDPSSEVSKTFPATTYPLSVTRAGTGTGSVVSTPAGISCGTACSASFSAGASVSLAATADVSSTFAGWSGACTGSGACSVTLDAGRNVTATFTLKAFSISATAGSSGAISPSGSVSVNYGGSQTFTLSPSTGYHVADVTVDGASVGAVTSYTFKNVTQNHSISASFAVNSYTVTPSAGANGSISPSTVQTVSHNGTTSFTVTPSSGYVIASVTGCGGTLSGSTYTTGPVTSSCAVAASFAALAQNTLAVTRTGYGTVTSTPAGIDCGPVCSHTFSDGTMVTLSASTSSGWNFKGWSGACSGTGNCTVSMTAARSVSATFIDVEPPALKVSSLPDGSVTGSQDLNVSGTVTDNDGLQGLTVNGTAVTVGSDGSFSRLVPLASGQNTIATIATDRAGNTASDARTITLDQTAPGLIVTSPADNSATAQSVATVNGTVSEASTVSVVLNGGSPQLASMNGGAFTAAVILRSGLNTITVTAKDSVGNSSSSVKRTVTYDDRKPAVSITDPLADLTTAQASVTVQGSVIDSLTASTASISVDGATAPLPLDGAGKFSASVSFSTEGPHTVVVTAQNQAGVMVSVQRNIQYTRFGDLNSSGSVELADAVLAFRHITGAQQLTDAVIRKRCDVAPLGADGRPHPDGIIDLGDVVTILRKVVGLVNW